MTESHTQGADVGQGGGLVLVLVATRSSGDFVEQTGRTPTRTSTRPPHPLHPTPCPYRTLGRKHLTGYDYPIRSSTFIRDGCGKRMVKQLPSPWTLSTATLPPIASIHSFTLSRPNPDPALPRSPP